MDDEDVADKDWLDIIPEVGEKGVVITVSGGQGSGKTGLGYYLLTLAEERDMNAYSYGVPKEKAHILPDGIERVRCEPQNLPQESFILIDESWIDFFAQQHGSSKNMEMGKMISLARQRKQVMIFVSHVLAKLNVNVVREVNTLVFKKPSILHMKFERPEIKDLTETAYDKLEDEEEYQKLSYVFSEDFEGVMSNPLPDFWSEELSAIYAGEVDIYEGSKYTELMNDNDYKELIKRVVEYEEEHSEEIDEEDYLGWEWDDVRGSPQRLNKLVRKGILNIEYKSNSATCYVMEEDKKEELKEVLDIDDD